MHPETDSPPLAKPPRGGHASRRVSQHSNAAFRSSRPSSTVCLKGPRSTTRTDDLSMTACRKPRVTPSARMGLASAGLACAAALSVCTAAGATDPVLVAQRNRTHERGEHLGEHRHRRRGVIRQGESPPSRASARGRVLASPLETFSASLGARDDASPTANRPRHSATTLRTPSSSLRVGEQDFERSTRILRVVDAAVADHLAQGQEERVLVLVRFVRHVA